MNTQILDSLQRLEQAAKRANEALDQINTQLDELADKLRAEDESES